MLSITINIKYINFIEKKVNFNQAACHPVYLMNVLPSSNYTHSHYIIGNKYLNKI